MALVKVFVEKSNDGTYWGTTQNLPGVVSAYGNTLEELKKNIKVAVDDYVETAVELEEDWIDEVVPINGYEFKMNIESFFYLVPQVKITAIARRAKINPSLMRQYATGRATVSEERLKLIQGTIHELGKELQSVTF
jgi:predicted RNase H-like HicB family nuclease|nr:type II toxin-antitoxin system HicB family antitoxin [Allomuricauda sp.]